MKKLLIGAFALSLAIAPAAEAILVILPELYASKFCKLRQAGLSIDDATKVAMSDSVVEGKSIKITYNGQEYDADVVQAHLAVKERCPDLL